MISRDVDPQYRERLRATLHEMASEPPPREKPAVVVALVAALGALLSGAVVVGLQPSVVHDSEVVVSCYSLAEVSETEPFERVTITQPEGEKLSAREATELCATLWAEGFLTDRSEAVEFQSSNGMPLTACATPQGVIAVLPGATVVCDDLGFHPLDEEVP